ncbi:MAG: efflux transporter periplasmic adaptor subunit, partial [Quisquiliibacterium sp.]
AGGQATVFRIVDGKAMRTRVQTGMRLEGKVEILSGVSGGDQVVTAGQLRLRRDAMPVRVVQQADGDTGASQVPAGNSSAGKAPAVRKPGA